MTKVTKAASPRSLAAPKASSSLPPIPRCISAIGVVSALATMRTGTELEARAIGFSAEGRTKLAAARDEKACVDREVLAARHASNERAGLDQCIVYEGRAIGYRTTGGGEVVEEEDSSNDKE